MIETLFPNSLRLYRLLQWVWCIATLPYLRSDKAGKAHKVYFRSPSCKAESKTKVHVINCTFFALSARQLAYLDLCLLERKYCSNI